jgi:ribose transport system substrate-binding protein
VRDGLVRAAEREHVELIVVDNRYQPKIALRSADYLIKEQVDLVVEFQTDELIAPAIASKYLERAFRSSRSIFRTRAQPISAPTIIRPG